MPNKDEHGALVNQASGMVSVQADCTVEEALALLKARAQTTGQSLDEIADAVVGRRLRFP